MLLFKFDQTTVFFNIRSQMRIHLFWIPELENEMEQMNLNFELDFQIGYCY